MAMSKQACIKKRKIFLDPMVAQILICLTEGYTQYMQKEKTTIVITDW